MEMQINVNTKIIYMDSAVPVMRAIENVKRDIRKVCCDSDEKGCDIVLIMENMQAEQFEIKCDNNMLVIYASDTLGFVYGLYHISRDILGVLPFWFWNDQVFIKKKGCRISGEYAYTSKPYAVKYRGWFVNDEVLIHKWYVDRKKDMPWEMVFEALLRCGGNLVIPGTDKNSHIYRDLAADMGLRITHHHAEPLGAPMFARRYPELTPSYDEYPEKFHELWKEGIDEQKKLDVIWNLGFRGQGDCPFWDNDPRYQTSESRGELMGKLIGLQRDYVQNEIPDAQYCTNLYGETMELYRDGYLKLPDDVIKIWADNGFGKMVTRRQGNHNPRIPALPKENNTGRHGIYYHVSFYDLQAANHITMLPNKPKLVHSELKKVLEHHVKDYWIINCSNVKPHVYYLDFIANMWRDGDVDIDKHLKGYIASYYGEDHITEIAECFRQYWQHALKYGEHEDDHAGEQFANHVARMLISQFMKDKSQRAEDLLWACDDKTLEGQVEWYKKLCAKGKESYEQLLCCYEKLDARLIDHERILFEDSLYLQAEIYYNCYSGALLMCEALCEAFQPYVDDGTIDVSQIADNVVDAGKVDKKLAGIVGGTGTVAIGYNPEVFKEAGIEEPNQDGSAWTWDEFVETAKTIKKKTGKYGICSGVADDTNIFNYWVRSHGEQLFSDDNKSLGYDDDQILVDYLDMWKDLMDCDAEPDPDEYTQIQSLGQEAGPVVTGDAAMLNENNNYASKMSSANPNLKVTIPPVSDINKKAIWNKPSYMLCISEKSKVKKEAAEFINWFINSEESNDIMMAERGVPSPQNIRDHLLDSGKLNEKQQEMFEYADQVVEYTGDTPDPDPMGISEVSKSLQDCAYSAFYGNITTKEAAEKFRKEANEILERNN